MKNADAGHPRLKEAVHPVPPDVVPLTAPAQRVAPVPHDVESEGGYRGGLLRVRFGIIERKARS